MRSQLDKLLKNQLLLNSKETQVSNRIKLFLLAFAVVWSPAPRHLLIGIILEGMNTNGGLILIVGKEQQQSPNPGFLRDASYSSD